MRVAVAAGSVLVAVGLVSAQVELFMNSWNSTSAGHPDIATRGGFLVVLYLPVFALVSFLVSAGLAVIGTVPKRIGWGWTLMDVAMGTAVGATVLLSSVALTAFGMIAGSLGSLGVGLVEGVFVVAGGWLLVSQREALTHQSQ